MGKLLRSAAAAVTGLALAVSAGIATELPANAAAGCSADFKTYNTVQKGYQGAQAKAVECLLDQAGYKVTINSSISAAEGDQIAKFRRSVGLDSVKAVGRRGWGALISHGSTPTLNAGATGANVLRVQLALRGGGYKATPTSSTLDAATVKVLKTAQKDNKLSQTGTVNAKTWKALQSGHLVVPVKAKKATVKKSSSSSKGEKALAFAKKQLGEKYKFGAAGPNKWDCSGLTMKAWKAAGKKLPHSAKAQYKKGKKVSKSKLKKGDLVFFYSGPSHVGIYAGGGKIIHASRPGKPVAYIKIKYMPYKGARRP
jgi:cell wall-associated NlpC family hydrolase